MRSTAVRNAHGPGWPVPHAGASRFREAATRQARNRTGGFMAARLDAQATSHSDSRPANAPEDIEIVPTGKALGAEVRGMDLSRPVPEASRAKLRAAWAEHLVLLWRGQNLPDESFLRAAEIFGPTKEPAARK